METKHEAKQNKNFKSNKRITNEKRSCFRTFRKLLHQMEILEDSKQHLILLSKLSPLKFICDIKILLNSWNGCYNSMLIRKWKGVEIIEQLRKQNHTGALLIASANDSLHHTKWMNSVLWLSHRIKRQGNSGNLLFF